MKPSLNVHFYITPYCPVPCHHCYYEALRPGMPYQGQLSTSEMVEVLVALDTEFDVDVHLEGGEAFLSEALAPLLQQVPVSIWQKVTITTSGALPLKLDASLLRRLGDLRISVEGKDAAQHRAMRGIELRGPETFMRRLKEGGAEFSIRSTLYSENWNDWREMAAYAAHRQATRLACYELQPVGRANATAAQQFLSDADVENFLRSLTQETGGALPLRCAFQFPERRRAAVARNAGSLRNAGWEVQELRDTPSLTINPNGDIGISPWKITASLVRDRIGNVRDPRWRRIIHEAHAGGALRDDSTSTSRFRISAGKETGRAESVDIQNSAHSPGAEARPSPASGRAFLCG